MPIRLTFLNCAASGLALSVALAMSGGALAGPLPSGGHFVQGHGQLDKSDASMTVKQSSTTAIIDWKNFDVGVGNTVVFRNGSGATLNRVTGGNLSRIAGSMHASGSLFLINAQGVIVSGTGKVVTGGDFVASSGNVSNSSFDDGDMLHFLGARAGVTNRGTIQAGGAARLIGGSVTQAGTVDAGAVALRAETNGVHERGIIIAAGSARHAPRIMMIARKGTVDVAGSVTEHGAPGLIETSGRNLILAGKVDAGKVGAWLIDPTNLIVHALAASMIDDALNDGTNVKLLTTKDGALGPGKQRRGLGDIDIDSALSWNSSATLALGAYHSLYVDAPIQVQGSGNVTLATHKGNLFFDGGALTFADIASTLIIDRANYTLVNNLATLASDIAANSAGDYALAGNYDAAADGVYANSPIVTTFNGNFQGLGNTISNLAIVSNNPDFFDTGLFSEIGANGTVDGLNLVGEKVKVADYNDVGGLAGFSSGQAVNDSVTGSISAGKHVGAGGLIGQLESGALVKDATADVTLYDQKPYAAVGGLVGFMKSATIMQSFASGNVRAVGRDSDVGGLVGIVGDGLTLGDGLVETSYATGNVSTGPAEGYSDNMGGGLVGENTGTLENDFATGMVSGPGALGGLVGLNESAIEASYSTGTVSSHDQAGGLVGDDESASGISSSYWDTTTSGISAANGAGNVTNDPGITGLSNAKLKAGIPAGFSHNIWAETPDINNGLPYLKSLLSTY